MLQDYVVFKTNSPAEATNKYYRECIDQTKVHIVITTKRKYARIDYDFDTLNNAKQHIKNLSKCNISDKIFEVSEEDPMNELIKFNGNDISFWIDCK